MGASIIYEKQKGYSMSEAWKKLEKEARERSGHEDGYSGDFNSCNLTQDVTSMLKSMGEKKLVEYMKKNCPKRDAWGFCIKEPVTNSNKVKTQVERKPQKGTRVWKTVYEAIDIRNEYRAIVSKESPEDCIAEARKYVEKNPSAKVHVFITKKLESGISNCAIITYKETKNQTEGTYVFVGCAPD
jgi:hypothetical protein